MCAKTFYQIGVRYERGSLNFFQYDQNHQSWHPATHNKCFRNWIFPSSRGRLRLAFYEFIMQIFIPNGNFLFSASQVQYQKAEVFVKKTYFDGSLTSH